MRTKPLIVANAAHKRNILGFPTVSTTVFFLSCSEKKLIKLFPSWSLTHGWVYEDSLTANHVQIIWYCCTLYVQIIRYTKLFYASWHITPPHRHHCFVLYLWSNNKIPYSGYESFARKASARNCVLLKLDFLVRYYAGIDITLISDR